MHPAPFGHGLLAHPPLLAGLPQIRTKLGHGNDR
jgi:hypothetical protein